MIKKSQKTFRTNVDTDEDFNIVQTHDTSLVSLSEYNEAGHLILDIHYSPEGEVMEKMQYDYDDKGNIIKHFIYYDENTIVERKEFIRDKQGKVIEVKKFYEEGDPDTVYHKYNIDGNLIEKITKNYDGEIEEREEYLYKNGKDFEEIRYDYDNEITFKQSYSYNEEEKYVERIIFEHDKGTARYTDYFDLEGRKIKSLIHDANNNLLQRNIYEYNNDKPIKIIEETGHYNTITFLEYDEKGNVVLQQETDKNEILTNRTARKFDENGELVETLVYIFNFQNIADLNYVLKFENEYYD